MFPSFYSSGKMCLIICLGLYSVFTPLLLPSSTPFLNHNAISPNYHESGFLALISATKTSMVY